VGRPDATVDQPPVSESPGTLIGPYKLLQEIGEGGMGAVWMAQQTEPVKRVVALKLIKAGMDSRQVIARFEAERQALALMDHPNIAKVLDAGTTAAGRPYFVMDLVKGVPITRYCDDHHLTPRQRLELFLPVCQAIQHAHQKGIIHRDIKPSNVLIALYDGKPVPKVIDFGVAKAAGQSLTDKTLVTGFGNIVGTLEYMSPEQAEINQLDIDTRSDIYSLGVLLYELLVGSPPFSRKELGKAGMLEMLRVIREQEPTKPSTKLSTAEGLPTLAANRGTEPAKLTRLLRGELDWIVMKALEKDRSRRYETANGFAMDVQRYLADEPVAAGPPSASYRLRKFVRRRRGPVLAASLILLAILAGSVVSVWQAVRATRAAESERLAKLAESDRAEGERRAKEEALEAERAILAVLEFVENRIFAAARPKNQEGGLGYDVKLADAVKSALPYVDRSFSGQPLIEARLRRTMGISFSYLHDNNTAIEQFRTALELRTRHLGPDNADTFQSLSNLTQAYVRAGRTREALELGEAVESNQYVKQA
jgi:serine/threonine protein kinase